MADLDDARRRRAGGLAVYRLQGAFGPLNPATPAGDADQIVPFNPKRVQLEVFGDPGATATITYMDVDSRPQRVDDAALPWSYDGSTTTPRYCSTCRPRATAMPWAAGSPSTCPSSRWNG